MMDPDSATPSTTAASSAEEPEFTDATPSPPPLIEEVISSSLEATIIADTCEDTTTTDPPLTIPVAVADAPPPSPTLSSPSPPFLWVENKPDVVVLVFGDMPGIYTGFVDPTHQLPHGPWGTLTYPDGRSYSGAWRLGHWHQQQECSSGSTTSTTNAMTECINAKLQLANGDVYIGQTNEQGQRHGCGQYTWMNDGRVYTGFWQTNLRHGQG